MTTQQTDWIEYTGSDEQISEMDNCNNGYILRYKNFNEGSYERVENNLYT